MDGSAGAGIFCESPELKISIPLGQYTSVFQAETYAISVCVKHCLMEGYHGKTIDICSDSQASLKTISSVQFKSKLVLECRKLLMSLAETNTVTLIWVPGHTNVQGNENADELARKGSEMDFVGPGPALPLTLSRVKTTIASAAHKKHVQYWKNLLTCQHSKLFLEEPLGVASKKTFNMNKRQLRILVGTVTGHFSCNYHLHKFGLRQSTLCDRCQSDEDTMYHLVCLCPSLAKRCLQIFGRPVLNSSEELQQLQLSKIMDFVTPLFLDPAPASD
jgi:ribonuclease HI